MGPAELKYEELYNEFMINWLVNSYELELDYINKHRFNFRIIESRNKNKDGSKIELFTIFKRFKLVDQFDLRQVKSIIDTMQVAKEQKEVTV